MFPPIFVADTKINFRCDFVAPLKWCVFNRRSFPTFKQGHDSSSGYFYLMVWYCFLNDLSVRKTFLTFARRKQCDNLMSGITWQKIRRYVSILIYPLSVFNYGLTLFELNHNSWILPVSVLRKKQFKAWWEILHSISDSQILSWKEENSETWNLDLNYRNYYLFTVWIHPSSFAWWRSCWSDRLLCLDD